MPLYKATEGSSVWRMGYSFSSSSSKQINSNGKRHKEELPRCKIRTPCSDLSGKKVYDCCFSKHVNKVSSTGRKKEGF